MKPKTFFTKNNPHYTGPVVSDTPRADGNNTLSVNADGYGQEVEVKMPLGQPTINKVGGQNKIPRLSNDRKFFDELIKMNWLFSHYFLNYKLWNQFQN